MSRRRTLIRLPAVLVAVALVWACGGDSATAPVEPPDPPRATTVTVSPATNELTALGATVQLTAEVRDQNARVMAGATVTWTNSANSVATVDASGLVTAAGNGTATITAGAGSASGSAVVTVMQSVASVEVSPSVETIGFGSTLQLTAEAFDENGDAVAGVEFSWQSSDAAVATVDASGLVTGVALGVATITASAGSAQGTAEIMVSPNPDRAALIVLYEATDGPNWVNSENWLTDPPLGDWYGVDTDDSGRVVRLDLYNNDLTGSIPPELGNLASLTNLELRRNNLTGPIPSQLGNLTSLTNLELGRNNLTGPIPSQLGNLTSLTSLELRQNELTGPIPPELGNLASLTSLELWQNELTGPIPPELGNLVNLTYLVLFENNLTGPIPAELGNLTSLTSLRVSGNRLSGPIPLELGNLASLVEMSLQTNRLTGPIPPGLGNLVNLTYLVLSGNNLTGPIPPELGTLTSLTTLGLNNDLTGPIPPELGNLTSLTTLVLANNDLTGPIPTELGNLASLTSLELQQNELTGPIPEGLVQIDGLGTFLFDTNADLCAPGTTDFFTWLKRIENVSGPYCNESDTEALEHLYQTSDGPDWSNSSGWLETPALEEWYGVTANSLGRVVTLDLARNGLEGRLPAGVGSLTEMTTLRLSGNALSDQLPLSLTRLSLVEFHYADTGLCAPAEASFRAWLNGIASHEGTGVECAPPSDREVLVALYEATDGPNWATADNWLTAAPLGDWNGVRADARGRVTELVLRDNELTGPIPPELGNLVNLTYLGLSFNNLTGPIPPQLGNLASLEWLGLSFNNLTGPIPPELGSLTGLTRLRLSYNNLTGPIPPELGNLANLTELWFSSNNLSDPIPPELGNLVNLTYLGLSSNNLTSAIPSALGNLASLEGLDLGGNELTGPIPPGLGNLTGLTSLELWQNELTGSIPPELGDLTRLGSLWLWQNELTGPIPPELGDLANLQSLLLDDNDLTGPVPPEFGGMSSLRRLSLTNNSGMSGALPARLTALSLEALLAGGTDLCAPPDPGFQAWLERVHRRRVAACANGDPSMAYLTQAVQSQEYPVPLVAGERALLRVFVTAGRSTTAGIPSVRARFYLNGTERHVADIPGRTTPIPAEVLEHDLSISANAEIPREIVQPGLEMVIEIDPEGTLDPSLGVAKRIPETGRLAVEVREMPVFDLTVIPFLWSADPDRAVVETAKAMEADPEGHELLWDTRTLLPIGDLEVTAHEPVLSSSNNAFALVRETEAIQAIEGGRGHYMGMMSGPVTGAAGVAATQPGRASFSIPNASVMAHELGHNLNLGHAPCGGARPDRLFPYPDGSTGAWGYDFRDGGQLVHPSTPELMSYCGPPKWISDYHFTNALRFRLFDEGPPQVAARSLLLWGGMDAEGEPFLNPTFVVDAPAALPDSTGSHRITGRTGGGGELFALSFAMPEVADGDGSTSFAFVLPARPDWAGNLASITLSGPDGSFTLDGDTDIPMAILLDPNTGQVRGILRDLPQADRAAALAPQAGLDSLDVLFSRGIPDTATWSR